MMTIEEISKLAVNYLPRSYKPLKLTFSQPYFHQSRDFIVIGNDSGTDLCVDPTNGAIYSIDDQKLLPDRFVNSGIEQLAKFIRTCESFSENSKKEVDILMWNELKSIDPKAFSKVDNWWSIILEQS